MENFLFNNYLFNTRKLGRVILMMTLLVGCTANSNESNQIVRGESTIQSEPDKGSFTAELNGKSYQVEVECSYFDQEYFKFQSDKTDITDDNGDGIIISGFQKGEKLVLTIVDQGATFSTANITEWTKQNNGITGSGVLFEDGSTQQFETSFTVKCP